MNELIGCRHCESPDCRGCNIYALETALRLGRFDGLMDGNRAVEIHADVVERKKGEWVGYPDSFKYEHVYDRDAIVCPFCEESWNIVDNDTERFNYCPNCGADMREEN